MFALIGMNTSKTVRYVATFTTGTSRAFGIVFACSAARALAFAKSLGLAAGADTIKVARETAKHNIPALDPVAWKARGDLLAEYNRRCGM